MMHINGKIQPILIAILSLIFWFGIGLFFDKYIPFPIIQPDLKNSQYLSIEDGWAGSAIYSPVKRSFILHRSDSVFIGNGSIRVGGDFVHSSTSYLSIQIPNDDVNKAIDILKRTNPGYGIYEPVITQPDDYPYIKMDLIVEGTRVEFYTSSQSPQKNPWAYKINNHTYVTRTGEPYSAFLILKKYLRDDIQEELEDLKKQYQQK